MIATLGENPSALVIQMENLYEADKCNLGNVWSPISHGALSSISHGALSSVSQSLTERWAPSLTEPRAPSPTEHWAPSLTEPWAPFLTEHWAPSLMEHWGKVWTARDIMTTRKVQVYETLVLSVIITTLKPGQWNAPQNSDWICLRWDVSGGF